MQFFDPLAWEIIPRLGGVISPHGVGIAIGFLAGAQLMVRRTRKRGGPDENDIWNVLFYALIGAIVGARVGYVLGHFSEVTNDGSDLLGVFKIWEGGISLIGGITGAVLAALPYMMKRSMGFWRTMDLAAPGLALGIMIGRLGDLMIGDHLGKPTDFALGWRCLGESGQPPVPAEIYLEALASGQPPSLGCFDLVLHQTALYDLFSTTLLFLALLFLGRKVRNTGFLITVFTIWYAAMRVITDFLRVDRRYFGLTGSQLMSITVGVICLYLLARYRGAPPRWAGPWGPDGRRGDLSGERSGLPPDEPPVAPNSSPARPEAESSRAPATESDENPPRPPSATT